MTTHTKVTAVVFVVLAVVSLLIGVWVRALYVHDFNHIVIGGGGFQ